MEISFIINQEGGGRKASKERERDGQSANNSLLLWIIWANMGPSSSSSQCVCVHTRSVPLVLSWGKEAKNAASPLDRWLVVLLPTKPTFVVEPTLLLSSTIWMTLSSVLSRLSKSANTQHNSCGMWNILLILGRHDIIPSRERERVRLFSSFVVCFYCVRTELWVHNTLGSLSL